MHTNTCSQLGLAGEFPIFVGEYTGLVSLHSRPRYILALAKQPVRILFSSPHRETLRTNR